MLIDIIQNKDSVELSYIDENNKIAVEDITLKDGYYNYVRAEAFEVDVIPNKISYEGSHFKKEPARYFKNLMINEFLNKDLELNNNEFYLKSTELRIPDPYSVDIEVLPTDEYGYSDAKLVQNPITSLSITDKDLNSLQFIVKNPNHPDITDADKQVVISRMQALLGPELVSQYDFNIEIRVFETEHEMLCTFLDCMRKYFNSIFGWNFITYDWTYIFNRCEKIGIDVKRASPRNKTKNKSVVISKSNDVRIQVKFPTHTIIKDYMVFFKESLIYSNLGSYSLDNIANDFLGIGKVGFVGNLRTLYNDDFHGYLSYGFIDTILVMLIHHKVGLYNVDFFESYINNIPYLTISQNNISNALLYNQLSKENKFLLTEEFHNVEKQHYPGGYVKVPIIKKVGAVIGIDYSALYPFSMITYGISPERYVDTVKVDKVTHRPVDLVEVKKWEHYKAQNCILTPTGRIYTRNNTDGIEEFSMYSKIELQKQEERGIFKSIKSQIYLDIIKKIDQKIKEKQ